MNSIIEFFKEANATIKSLGVTLGGLVGVFATLGFFFLLIWAADEGSGTLRGIFRKKD